MQQELLLQQKITRMIVLSIPRIQNMRKPEKYTLGKYMEDAMCGMLEAAIDGNLEKGSKRHHAELLRRHEALRQQGPEGKADGQHSIPKGPKIIKQEDKTMDILLSPGQLITIMGIPTAVTAFCFWLIERRIQKRDKKKEEEAAERAKAAKAAAEKKEKEEAQREAAREQLQILTIQMTNAAIALGEATAKAVQRIPDAQCNGDMHAALDYAAQVKHEQKEFLTSIGIKSILE